MPIVGGDCEIAFVDDQLVLVEGQLQDTVLPLICSRKIANAALEKNHSDDA
jgi:hypothetical protein